MNIFEFDPHIYPRKLWIAVDVTTEDLITMFDEDGIENTDDCYATTYIVQQKTPSFKGILVRFENLASMTTGNIAHESIHAAWDILHQIGSRADYINQEPFAYLAGWVARCCDEVKNSLQNDLSRKYEKESV